MTLKARIGQLERQLPPVNNRRPIPTDLLSFAAGFAAGDFGVEDIDMTDYNQTTLFYAFAIRAIIAHDERQASLESLEVPAG